MSEKNMLKKTIGKNIKAEREKAGLTQEVLSEMVSLEPKTLSAVERGTVGLSIPSLVRICDVLKVSPSAILYEQTAENNVQSLIAQISRLPPEQFALVSDAVRLLLKAFDANSNLG